ncbi:hypothetical protein OH491_24745 [Termitidicoccus mucosus]|uniref:hypothetical protein n=1 Tax=Termitidicoccus mucosus TaxID=1184151 RepID=UPI002FEE11EA
MINDDATSTETKADNTGWPYVQIAVLKPDKSTSAATQLSASVIDPNRWTPWKYRKGDDIDLIRRLAMHRFLRTSGYLCHGALPTSPPLTVQIAHYIEGAPLHPNRTPKEVMCTIYTIIPD